MIGIHGIGRKISIGSGDFFMVKITLSSITSYICEMAPDNYNQLHILKSSSLSYEGLKFILFSMFYSKSILFGS